MSVGSNGPLSHGARDHYEKLINHEGIAVSAGELEEENAKTLAKTTQERDQALEALHQAQEELRALRTRLTSFEGDSSTS